MATRVGGPPLQRIIILYSNLLHDRFSIAWTKFVLGTNRDFIPWYIDCVDIFCYRSLRPQKDRKEVPMIKFIYLNNEEFNPSIQNCYTIYERLNITIIPKITKVGLKLIRLGVED